MKILVDKKIKALFCKIVVCILGYALLSLTIVVLNSDYMMLYLFLCVLGMFIAIIGVCYGHFKKQDEIMENAAAKITEYISGNKEARIPCDGEGEMYRLFHEVNLLAYSWLKMMKI